MLVGIRWGGLRAKIFAWSFVPTAVLLAGVGLVSLGALQSLALGLVVDRDRELARASASMLASELQGYASALRSLGAAVAAAPSPPGASRALAADAVVAELFDGGLVALDGHGVVLAARPAAVAAVGADWSVRPFVRQALGTARTAFSPAQPGSGDGARVVHVVLPVLSESRAVRATIVGALRLGASPDGALAVAVTRLPLGRTGAVLVVDGEGNVVHAQPPLSVSAGLGHRPEVSAALAGRDGALRTRDLSGRETLAGYAPIADTGWALVTHEPWSDVTASLRGPVRVVMALLAVGLVVPALVVNLGVRRITGPLNELIVAAREVAAGQFGRTISADTGDEIEQLARQFNLMSTELEASYRKLEQRVAERTQELAVRSQTERRRAEQFRLISEVNQRTTRILPLDELLDQIVQLTQQALGYDHVGIGLVEGDHVRYLAGAGPMWHGGPAHFEPGTLQVGKQGITGWVAELGEAVLLPDVLHEPRYVHLEGSATRSELAVPIIVKGRVVGVLDAQSSRLSAFDETDLLVMQAVANHAGVAIDNARLYAQARQAAVLEERQRMARDLHDSVTQSLYGVTLYGDAAARLLETGDLEGATEYCTLLRQAAREALAEMRLLIFELRPAELEGVGLVGALQARLDGVESRAGLASTLEADPELRAPPGIEEALYRIALEALNNTLKHARAAHVVVRVAVTAGSVVLEILDDGVGFDPAAGGAGGMGLHSMAERAQMLGGATVIDSRPGAGTRVRVEVPL